MLAKEALDSALPLAERFDNLGIIVRPVGGTPLDVLVNNCAIHQFEVSPTTGAYLTSAEISELTARPSPVTGYSAHELDMKELKTAVADAVRNHLKFARTVVAPDVLQFVEAIAPAVQEIARNPLHDVEIVQNNSYAFLYEPELKESIERASDIPVDDVPMNFKHGPRTDAEVLEIMTTGSASLDQAVTLFVSKLPEGALAHIWATMFTQIPQSDGDSSKTFQQLLNQQSYNGARSLVTYLVARKLWNNPPEDSNATAKAYEDLMVEYRNQSALALLRERYRQDVAAKAGLLVESIREGKVFVNSNVYREWIRNGGTNEVLLGLTLSNNPAQRVEVINEQAEAYKLAWKNHVALSQSVIRNRRFERTKDLLDVEFKHYLTNLTPEELPVQDRALVLRRFEHALGKVKLEECDPENLYTLVLHLLCKARYHETDAFFILNTVQRVSRDNPGMDVREAASIATIEYIARWVGSQMRVEPARG